MLKEHTELMRQFYYQQENNINAWYFIKVHNLLDAYINIFEDPNTADDLFLREELTEPLFEFFKTLFRVDEILDNIDENFRTRLIREELIGSLKKFFDTLFSVDETQDLLMLTCIGYPVQVEDDS